MNGAMQRTMMKVQMIYRCNKMKYIGIEEIRSSKNSPNR